MQKLKDSFALFGMPEKVVSDNGPQFSSSLYIVKAPDGQQFRRNWMDISVSDIRVSVEPPVKVIVPTQLLDAHDEAMVERADEAQSPDEAHSSAEQPEPAGDVGVRCSGRLTRRPAWHKDFLVG